MWTGENRGRHDRSKLRDPTDPTDGEWGSIAPLIPPAEGGGNKGGGNKRGVSLREVVNGLMDVLGTGCQWPVVPKDLPPRSTVSGDFDLWDHDGTLHRIHHAPCVACREKAGREAGPSAAIIDSQSLRSAERGSRIDPSDYDAGKKIKGKKRHVLQAPAC